MRCLHPNYPLPLSFVDARDDESRCGSNGRWWETLDSQEPPT